MLDGKESGRLTYRQFRNLYREYKYTFDLELLLIASHTTYAALKKKEEDSEEWF